MAAAGFVRTQSAPDAGRGGGEPRIWRRVATGLALTPVGQGAPCPTAGVECVSAQRRFVPRRAGHRLLVRRAGAGVRLPGGKIRHPGRSIIVVTSVGPSLSVSPFGRSPSPPLPSGLLCHWCGPGRVGVIHAVEVARVPGRQGRRRSPHRIPDGARTAARGPPVAPPPPGRSRSVPVAAVGGGTGCRPPVGSSRR
jgi:hypothetical protein